jgi:hypothetical protein
MSVERTRQDVLSVRLAEDGAIVSQPREVAMLTILLATCETSLQAFRAAENPVDAELVEDLERMVERTRRELDTLRGSGV